MCAIFGFMNYKRNQSNKLLDCLYQCLAKESEERGVDASGVAYVKNKKLIIHKKGVKASLLNFVLPHDVYVITGHTRLTTQGTEKNNYNNHPFRGKIARYDFALSHNGIIWNDKELRKKLKLPNTRIETDSYVITQLINQLKTLSLESLTSVVEQLEGNFTLSIIDNNENLYLIRNDNPLVVIDFVDIGIIIYASTIDILIKALLKANLFEDFILSKSNEYRMISMTDGDQICIDRNGVISKSVFTPAMSHYFYLSSYPRYQYHDIELSPLLKKFADVYSFSHIELMGYVMDGWSDHEIIEYLSFDDGYIHQNHLKMK